MHPAVISDQIPHMGEWLDIMWVSGVGGGWGDSGWLGGIEVVGNWSEPDRRDNPCIQELLHYIFGARVAEQGDYDQHHHHHHQNLARHK